MSNSPEANQRDRCVVASSAGQPASFFGFIDEHSRRSFAERTHLRRYAQGVEIASQSNSNPGVGMIVAGLVKIVTISEQGEEHVLQLLQPGQIIGIPTSRYSHFMWEAALDSEIRWMPQRSWDNFLQEKPQHVRAFLFTMQQQLEEMQLSVSRMRGRTTLQRVARWLVEQAPKVAGSQPPRIEIVLRRRDLASLLDMTAETLCRSLRLLDDRGAIRLIASDCAEIVDRAKLHAAAGCADTLPRRIRNKDAARKETPDWTMNASVI